MRNRFLAFTAIAVCMAGCSGAGVSRLDPATKVMVYHPEYKWVPILYTDGPEREEGAEDDALKVGTEALVVADTEEDGSDEYRKVSIRTPSGQIGLVSRSHLRPIRQATQ